MPTVTPSRNLDDLTVEVTTNTNDKVCQQYTSTIIVDPTDPTRILQYLDVTDECGAPATHQVIVTCCNRPVIYRCTDHVHPPAGASTTCGVCHHRCPPGVCYHRIVLPL